MATHEFYRKGIRVTGIDSLIKMSDVAKATFYRYFPTKDDLIFAYVEESSRHYWLWFEGTLEGLEGLEGQEDGSSPKEQFMGLISSLVERKMNKDHLLNRGCPFLNVILETPPEHPAHQAALAHLQKVCSRISEMAYESRDSTQVTSRVFLLMQAITHTPCHLPDSEALLDDVVRAATLLLEDLCY